MGTDRRCASSCGGTVKPYGFRTATRDDAGEQTRGAIRRTAPAFEQVGAGLEHVVRTRMFVTDISRWESIGRAHGEFFADIRPASSMVEVSALIDPALLVEVEVEVEADAIVP